jgi:hypothetical protein
VTGAMPLGNALGDILDAFRGTHRSAAVFVNDESHLLVDASDCAKAMKLHEEWLPVKAEGQKNQQKRRTFGLSSCENNSQAKKTLSPIFP